MARLVYYSREGDFYRLFPLSRSQVKQLLSAGLDERVEEEERLLGEELEELLSDALGGDVAEALFRRGMSVTVPGGGVLVAREGGLAADRDGIGWLKRVCWGRMLLVLDPAPGERGGAKGRGAVEEYGQGA